ncbi:MAG: hypothetical protein KY437_08555 [Actinobacteria bacterium]|nr:hypothetical protein [Actinomycetota bacterium]
MTLESLGIPTAPIVTRNFEEEARAQREALGAPDLVPALIDHPLSTLSDDQIRTRARQAVDQVRQILSP